MFIKIKLSATEIYTIRTNRLISTSTNDTTNRLMLVYDSGVDNISTVINLTINSGKAEEVLQCMHNKGKEHDWNNNPYFLIIDAVTGYKCCTDIISATVSKRSI